MTGYRVDVEELALVVSEMAACQRALEELAGDVETVTTRLHEEWSGLSRDAHLGSHARWRAEFRDMSEALGSIRDLGDAAHTNYSAAVGANLSMWGRVR